MEESVLEWLDSIQLGQYSELLHENGFTSLADLQRLTEESLLTIGITKRGHRTRILQRLPKVAQPQRSSPVDVTAEIPRPAAVHRVPQLPPDLPRKMKSLDSVLEGGSRSEGVSLAHDLPSAPPPEPPPKQPGRDARNPEFDEGEYFETAPGTVAAPPPQPPPPKRADAQNAAKFDDPEYLDVAKDESKPDRTVDSQSKPVPDKLPPPPPPVENGEKPVLPPRPATAAAKPKPKKPPRRRINHGDPQRNSSATNPRFSTGERDSIGVELPDSLPPRPVPRHEDVPPVSSAIAAVGTVAPPLGVRLPAPIPREDSTPPLPHRGSPKTVMSSRTQSPAPKHDDLPPPPPPPHHSEDTVVSHSPLPVPRQDDRPPLPLPPQTHAPPLPRAGDRPPPPIPRDASGDARTNEPQDNSISARPPMPVPVSDHQQQSTGSDKDSFGQGSASSGVPEPSLPPRASEPKTNESVGVVRPRKEAPAPPPPRAAPRSSIHVAEPDFPPPPSPGSRMPTRAPPPPPVRSSNLSSAPAKPAELPPPQATDRPTPAQKGGDQSEDDSANSGSDGEYVDMTVGSLSQPQNISLRPPMHLRLRDRDSVRRSIPGMEGIPLTNLVPPQPQLRLPDAGTAKPPSEGSTDTDGPRRTGERSSSFDPVQSRRLPEIDDGGDPYSGTQATGGIYDELIKNIKEKPDKNIGNDEMAYDVLVNGPRQRSNALADARKRVSNLIDLSPEISPRGRVQPSVILPGSPMEAYLTTNLIDGDDRPTLPPRGHFHSPPPDFPPPPPPPTGTGVNSEDAPYMARTPVFKTFGRPSVEDALDSMAPPPPPRVDSELTEPDAHARPPHRPAPQVPPLPVRVQPKPVLPPTVPDLPARPPAVLPHLMPESPRDSTCSNWSSLEPLKDESEEAGDSMRGYDSDVSDTSDETMVYDELQKPNARINEMKRMSTTSVYTPSERPTQKEGYLFKQGGKQRNRGWRKRWVVYNGKDLRYYGNKGDKVSKRIIPVGCMCNVEIPVKGNLSYLEEALNPYSFLHPLTGDKPFRFFLVASNRKFEFAAETNDEMSKWGSTLMEGIIRYKPPEGGFPEGGDMFNPDKEGPVKIDSEKRYMAIKGAVLCYYVTQEDYKGASPISEIEMKIATVKDPQNKKLTLVTAYQQQTLTFESNDEMKSWARAMNEAIAEGLGDPKTLLYVRQNPSNRFCADCGAENPDWTSINLCVVFCKQCAGHHRGLGVEISKVRSLRMDDLAQTVQQLLLKIGNSNFNSIWEGKPNSSEFKIKPTAEKDHRRIYIEKKYRQKQLFKPHGILMRDGFDALNEALIAAATSDDCLLDVAHMVFSGADPNSNETGVTAIEVAKENNQPLIMEFLSQNTGVSTPSSATSDSPNVEQKVEPTGQHTPPQNPPVGYGQSDPHDLNYTGFLYKTGSTRKEFQKRWCKFENGAFTYYVDDKATAAKNTIEARDILSVSCTNPNIAIRLGHSYCFEIGTITGRTYLFSADRQIHQRQWIKTITKSIAPACVWDDLENFDRAGTLYMKESAAGHWQKTWFILKGKWFMYFSAVLMAMETLDLRKLINLSAQTEVTSEMTAEGASNVSAVVMPGRTLYFHSDTKQENEEWFAAIKAASMKSGRNLHEQQLTAENVPILVSMCIDYIAVHGISEEGIYRRAGVDSKVKMLLEDFSTNARAVNLDEYPVHEVANALKRFFRNLPDPLLTKALYPKWIEIAGYDDHNGKLRWYKYYLHQLPPINRETLKKLIGHLIRVSEKSSENKMVIGNLAAVWGPTLMSSATTANASGFGDANSEIAVIGDIITYYNWLFDISEEDAAYQKQVEQKIAEGLKIIENLTGHQKQTTCTGFLIGAMFGGTALNVRVSPDATADQFLHKAISNNNLDSSKNYALFEVLCNGHVERPMHGSENVLQVQASWSQDNKGAENSLCIKENYLLPKWQAAGDISPFGTVKINSDKKAFKKMHLELQGKTLRCFKDMRGLGKPEGEWCLDNVKIYAGGDQRKSPPTKYAFTCKLDDNKTRIVCVESDYDLSHWVGSLLKAKYPDGFSARELSQGAESSVAQYQPGSNPTLQLNVPFLSPDGTPKLKSPLRDTLGKNRFEAFAAELHSKARKYSVRKKKH